MNFDQIKRLKKRADHFVPMDASNAPGRSNPWALPLAGISPTGMGVAAHNFASMQEPQEPYLSRLLWLDALAASFNRFIDGNRIEHDDNAKRCLAWWRSQLFLDPGSL